jgi:hypothetical protein
MVIAVRGVRGAALDQRSCRTELYQRAQNATCSFISLAGARHFDRSKHEVALAKAFVGLNIRVGQQPVLISELVFPCVGISVISVHTVRVEAFQT